MRARQQTKKWQASFLRRSIKWTTRSSRKQHCINVAVQSLNPVQLFVTPWTAAHQPSLSFTISWSLFKLMSIEFVLHLTISFSVTPFSSCPQSFPVASSFTMTLLFILSGQRMEASAFSNRPSNDYSGLISFRIDWFDLSVQGTFNSFLQHNLKAFILWHLAFFIIQLSHPYMTTGKTIALNRWTFVSKVISLLFVFLSFLSHSKFPLAIYFTHGNVSFHISHPLLPSPHVCFSIAAL